MEYLILRILWGKWREWFLLHTLSPIGWALYQALQSADGWVIDPPTMTYYKTVCWWVSNRPENLKLYRPEQDVLTAYDKHVCWKELQHMKGRIVAMQMQRLMLGGGT